MTTTYQINERINELKAEIAKMEREKERIAQDERLEVIAKIRNLMNGCHPAITFEEIDTARMPKRTREPKGMPKYGDGQGNTWTGKGKKPQWMVNALANGKAKEDYLLER